MKVHEFVKCISSDESVWVVEDHTSWFGYASKVPDEYLDKPVDTVVPEYDQRTLSIYIKTKYR